MNDFLSFKFLQLTAIHNLKTAKILKSPKMHMHKGRAFSARERERRQKPPLFQYCEWNTRLLITRCCYTCMCIVHYMLCVDTKQTEMS